MRAHDLVVAHEELEVQLLRQVEAVEDALVPERGPALVHDLGLDLRDEVLRLLVDDGEEILLPSVRNGLWSRMKSSRSSSGDERRPAQIGLDVLRAAVDALERIGRAAARRRAAARAPPRGELLDREVAPALQRQRVRGVEDRLDPLDADARILDVARARGRRAP